MFRTIAIAAVFALAAGGAMAQSAERQIRDQLRAQGFTNIQIERDDGKIEVEARRGNQKIELKYDARTGRVISRSSERVTRGTPNRGSRHGVTRSWSNDDDDDRGSRGGRSGGGSRNDDDDDDGGSRGGGGGGGG
ncbi:MAG: PepSY domain-containing protein, partial [Paracoccus sp. (in: a-proteobacteria)]|nr:PepSY domain-containing protein [Paracoccus sp. (in: a-proteobacteria)]